VKVALDTNVLAYAEGIYGTERRDAALALIRKLPQEAGVVPIQVLGELFNVLVRKAGKSRREARDALLSWRDTFSVVETSSEAMLAAADLAMDHQLGIWDAVILSAAAQGGVSFAFVRGPSGRFHLGRGDGGQSIRCAATCPSARLIGSGMTGRIAKLSICDLEINRPPAYC